MQFSIEYGRRKRVNFGKRTMKMKQDAESLKHRTMAVEELPGSSSGKTREDKRCEDRKKVGKVRKVLNLPEPRKKAKKAGGFMVSGGTTTKIRK